MKKPFHIILILAGVFVCGAVAGGALSIRYYERFVSNKGADRFILQQTRELGEALALTPEQKKETRVLFSRFMEEQRGVRKQFEAVNQRMIEAFEAVLTPEQRTLFQEHRAKRREAERLRMRELRERRERDGDGSGRFRPPHERERERPPPPPRGETAPPPPGPEAVN
jgi:hypothetical protein